MESCDAGLRHYPIRSARIVSVRYDTSRRNGYIVFAGVMVKRVWRITKPPHMNVLSLPGDANAPTRWFRAHVGCWVTRVRGLHRNRNWHTRLYGSVHLTNGDRHLAYITRACTTLVTCLMTSFGACYWKKKKSEEDPDWVPRSPQKGCAYSAEHQVMGIVVWIAQHHSNRANAHA